MDCCTPAFVPPGYYKCCLLLSPNPSREPRSRFMDNAKVEFLYMHSLRALPMKTTDTVLFSLKSSQQSGFRNLNFHAKYCLLNNFLGLMISKKIVNLDSFRGNNTLDKDVREEAAATASPRRQQNSSNNSSSSSLDDDEDGLFPKVIAFQARDPPMKKPHFKLL